MEMAEEQAKQEEQILKYGMHAHTHIQDRTLQGARQSDPEYSDCTVKYVTDNNEAQICTDSPSVAH